jgi:hypothetical protein
MENADLEQDTARDQMGCKRSQGSLGAATRQAVDHVENSQRAPVLPTFSARRG